MIPPLRDSVIAKLIHLGFPRLRRLYWGSEEAATAAAKAANAEGRNRRLDFNCGTCCQQGITTPVKTFKTLVAHYADVHDAADAAEATRWATYDLVRDACTTAGVGTSRWQDMWTRFGIKTDLVAKMKLVFEDDMPWDLLEGGRRPGPPTAWEEIQLQVPMPSVPSKPRRS